MWIFTKHGFFSAVCARQGNGSPSILIASWFVLGSAPT